MTEFEESEFRGPLFNQLERGSHLLWEPGQVFEKTIGVDRASLCVHDYLWKLYGFSAPLGGSVLRSHHFHYIWTNTKPKKVLPDFNLNLFIQAKRSEYSSRSKVKLSPQINGAHWYFEVTPHQQVSLELLEKELAADALVVYAAPVFHEQQQLYNHTSNQTIVSNSTFPKVSMLTGHSKWYYNKGGLTGVANPDFEDFDEVNLLSQIETLRNQTGDYRLNSRVQNLQKLSQAIRNVVEKQSNSFQATRFAYERELIDDMILDYELNNYVGVKDYMQIELFNYLWKLNWLTF
ncbi:hypothetical protein [Pedobacter psychrodurus]|uniref:hypothetical protein n=1 Tax=Pedobacter psychrodurus TaxID=2530456 RepID=UPI00292FD8AF|nr:hypothetical protein [Pedobacter psychrodurus]